MNNPYVPGAASSIPNYLQAPQQLSSTSTGSNESLRTQVPTPYHQGHQYDQAARLPVDAPDRDPSQIGASYQHGQTQSMSSAASSALTSQYYEHYHSSMYGHGRQQIGYGSGDGLSFNAATHDQRQAGMALYPVQGVGHYPYQSPGQAYREYASGM